MELWPKYVFKYAKGWNKRQKVQPSTIYTTIWNFDQRFAILKFLYDVGDASIHKIDKLVANNSINSVKRNLDWLIEQGKVKVKNRDGLVVYYVDRPKKIMPKRKSRFNLRTIA